MDTLLLHSSSVSKSDTRHCFKSCLFSELNKKTSTAFAVDVWWRLGDSNSRPLACEASALAS